MQDNMAAADATAAAFEEEKQHLLRLCAEVDTFDNDDIHCVGREHRQQVFEDELFNASEELRSDAEVAWAAIGVDGALLQCFSEALREDFHVASAAVANNVWAFASVTEARRMDADFIAAVLLEVEDEWSARFVFQNVPWEAKQDEDMALFIFRHIPGYQYARLWHQQLEADVQLDKPFERFDNAAWSCLALAGQAAPILSVTLSRVANRRVAGPEGDDNDNDDNDNEDDDSSNDDNSNNSCRQHWEGEASSGDDHEEGFSYSYICEAMLLSGTCLRVEIPDRPTCDWWGFWRPGPILNDLAMQLVGELSQRCQEEAANHVFIDFPRVEGDHVLATVWDCDRPLSDFIFAE